MPQILLVGSRYENSRKWEENEAKDSLEERM